MDNRENQSEEFDLKKEIMSYIIMVVVVVGVVLFLNTFIVINARIPSSSMEKTIMVNDRIFGSRLAYTSSSPERFDIVIFKYPDDEKTLFIKRVIGLPGETVSITDGKVYINGASEPLDDSFCPETPLGSFGPYTVPENCYFMMGDNRNNSHDSRFWTNTYVREDQILGKAIVRYWPITEFGTVK